MDRYLLVISRDYWGTISSESTALRFMDKFRVCAGIVEKNVMKLFGNEVTVSNVKKVISNAVKNALGLDVKRPRLYIYMNGHGNQVGDVNGDERNGICNGESLIDEMDEVYQLPDGNVLDDDITEVINCAVKESGCDDKKLMVILISDHCSSGSMIDKVNVEFDWVSIGSSMDNQDSYVTGDGNVMTNVLLDVLCDIKGCVVLECYRRLDKGIRESFIGEMQVCTLHVSCESMLYEVMW